MREALDRDLNRITENFLRMVSLVREELELATAGLVAQDVAKAEEAVRLDEKVDALDLEIENEVLAAIARHQPVAGDLRFLATVLKALTDLERAGDYAAHVAEDALALAGEPPLKKYIVLAEMSERLERMLDLLAKAIAERDLAAADPEARRRRRRPLRTDSPRAADLHDRRPADYLQGADANAGCSQL